MSIKLNLQMFAEGEEGAAAIEPAAAETATAAESTTENFAVNAGDTLPDGQAVSSQVAAAMNKQMERHPELRQVYGQGLKRGQKGQVTAAEGQAAGQTGAPAAEKTIEERWNEAKKGEFAELFGRDVQSAIHDRFKNQADANGQLNALEPMLKVLRERAGVKSNEELINHVLDDDSLYEEAAEEAGMSVAGYKQFVQMQNQLAEAQKREQQSIQDRMVYDHYASLSRQAEEMKKEYPDFNLQKELQNKRFFNMTKPEGGISVRDAYFAIHHDELAPQMLAYGMERAKQQMGQTIQAQRRRPAEGAMKTQGQPTAADFNLDMRQLKPAERKKIYDLIHKGKLKWG